MRRVKVALFTDTYLPTINGITYAVQGWKRELESRGHEATVFCPSPGGEDTNVTFPAVNFPFYEGFRAAIWPPWRHDMSQYDAVHINSFFLVGYWGYRAARRHDLPLVSMVHTPIHEYLDYVTSVGALQRLGARLYRRWEARLLARSDVRVAPSAFMQDYVEEVAGDCRLLTNGVDTEFFQPTDADAFRERHGIHADRIVGYTGRLGSEKRVEELVEFAERFDGEVVVGGDGPYREEYEEIAGDNVRFLGFVPREELPAFYSLLDLFVIPSRVENDPLTVLEANACGTPVVGADAAGLTDSVVEGENGLRYEPGSIDDLARAVEEGYDDLAALSEGAVASAEEQSISRTVDRLIEFYTSGAPDSTRTENFEE